MTKFEKLQQALFQGDFGTARMLVATDTTLLSQRDDADLSLIEIFSHKQKYDRVEWLCKQMLEYNLPTDFYDTDGLTPTQNAYQNNWQEAVKTLLQYTDEPNLRQWLVQRQLICILGTNFLLKNFVKVNEKIARAAEGGFRTESAHLLLSAATHLLALDERYNEIRKTLANFYKFTHTKKTTGYSIRNILREKNKPRVLFDSGYQGHLFTVSIKQKESGFYELTFYDANQPEQASTLKKDVRLLITGEFAVVRRILVKTEYLNDVVDTLIANLKKPKAIVKAWLTQLPVQLGSEYQYDQTILNNVNEYEKDRCYWENPRLAVYDLFIDQFGEEAGLAEFNAFMGSIHLKLIENFKVEYANQYNEEALLRLEKSVESKLQKPSLMAAAVRALGIVTAFSSGVILVDIAIGSLFNVASVLALFGIASLGPLGSLACLVVGVCLMAAQITIPVLIQFVAEKTGYIEPHPEPLDLVLEDKVKENSARLFVSSNAKVKASLAAATEEKPMAAVVASVKPKKSLFKNAWKNIKGFFDDSAKKKVVPVVEQKKIEQKARTHNDDINDLWPLQIEVKPR